MVAHKRCCIRLKNVRTTYINSEKEAMKEIQDKAKNNITNRKSPNNRELILKKKLSEPDSTDQMWLPTVLGAHFLKRKYKIYNIYFVS